MNWKALVQHPLSYATGLGSGVLAILEPNTLLALAGFVWMNIGALFPGFSTLAFLVIPEIDVPLVNSLAPIIRGIAVVLAMVFVLRKFSKGYAQLQDRF